MSRSGSTPTESPLQTSTYMHFSFVMWITDLWSSLRLPLKFQHIRFWPTPISTRPQLSWRMSLIKNFWVSNWNLTPLRWSTNVHGTLAKYFHPGPLHLQQYSWVALLPGAPLYKKERFPNFRSLVDYINFEIYTCALDSRQKTWTGSYIEFQNKDVKIMLRFPMPLFPVSPSSRLFSFFLLPLPVLPSPCRSGFWPSPVSWLVSWSFHLQALGSSFSIRFSSYPSPWLLPMPRSILMPLGKPLIRFPAFNNYKHFWDKASILTMTAQETFKFWCTLLWVASEKKWTNIWTFLKPNMWNTKPTPNTRGKWCGSGNVPQLPYILPRPTIWETPNSTWTRSTSNGPACRTYQDGG